MAASGGHWAKGKFHGAGAGDTIARGMNSAALSRGLTSARLNLSEGEMRLRSKMDSLGKRLSPGMLEATQKSVDNTRQKITQYEKELTRRGIHYK